ncbi:MAG: hypothetical protein WKF85_00565 [Chitinophagaceae bacterium]
MKRLNAGNLKGYGTDANWDIKYKDGQFYSFTPNSTFKIYHFEYENTVHINTLGGRVTQLNEKVDTNNIIPFTGDSFVMGVGVEDTENIVSLSKKTTTYNFLNLGVAGSCMPVQRKIINSRYDELGKPSIVIYGFFLGNDYFDIIKIYSNKSSSLDSGTAVYGKPGENDGVSSKGFVWKLNYIINNNWFLKKLYVLQFIKQKILNMRNKNKAKDMYEAFYILNTANTEYIKNATILIDKEIEILSKEPYKSIVVLIPDKYQINTSLRKVMSAYYNIEEKNLNSLLPNKILINALDKYKVKYIDPTQCITNQQSKGDLYYTNDAHFTKLGQKVISDCIKSDLENILQQLKLKGR